MNRIKSLLSVLFLALILSNCGQAQNSGNVGKVDITWSDKMPLDKVTATVTPSSGVKVGDVITLKVTVTPSAGWHLYSAIPPEGFAYKGTVVDADDGKNCKGVKVSGATTENKHPHEEEDEIMGGIVRHFDNAQSITYSRKYRVTEESVSLDAYIDGQVCQDNGQCVPYTDMVAKVSFKALPKEEKVETPVDGNPDEVVETPADTGTANTDTSAHDSTDGAVASVDSNNTGATGAEPAIDLGGGTEEEEGMSLWWIFFQSFLFGFAALLTPCVFPMIPLTVSFFVKQSKTRAQGIRNAWFYGGSIIAIYVLLGVVISAALGPAFLYNMSSMVAPNLIFFILFFIFALSFLGMFEITLPSSWATKMDSQSNKGGMLGIFFMALTLAIVSFSCTGPLVGTALVSAAKGENFWAPVMGMFGFGASLAIPFGLFAAFPGWLNSMPRSGSWLTTVKVFLGFLELALCMKFLSNADLAGGWHIVDREVFIAIWFVIFALLGVYLLGFIRLPHDSKTENISVPRFMIAVASFSFAMYIFPGLWGQRLVLLEGMVPPVHNEMGVRILPHQEVGLDLETKKGLRGSGAGGGTYANLNEEICDTERNHMARWEANETHGFCLFYDLYEAQEYAKEKNLPLFVDFTGWTCANCRRMEQNVWTDPTVTRLFKEEFVMVSLYVDEHNERLMKPDGQDIDMGDHYLELETERYGAIAQPLYAIWDTDGSDLVKEVGYTPTVATYVEFLETGLKNFKLKHGIPLDDEANTEEGAEEGAEEEAHPN